MLKKWTLPIIAIVLLILLIRNKKRGFFWKARDGEQLTFRQFLGRWGKGIEGITPLQQTKTSLLGFPLIYGGTITGIIIMILRKEWWLLLILVGSLPILTMSLVSTLQKYITQKKIYQTMKELENEKM
jgi:hypothetical protein